MPAIPFSYDVFLSHSSKDKPAVRRLAERLRKDGLSVWFDEWEIRPGDSIPRKIDEGLEQSAVLILCMSANSLGSDWAEVESQTFRFMDPVNRDLRFIPLRLDDTEPRASLRQFAYVDWRGEEHEDAYARLISVCRLQRGRGPQVHKPKRLNTASRSADPATRVVKGHALMVDGLALTGDGHYLMSCSADKTVRLWSLENDFSSIVLARGGGRALAVAIDSRGSCGVAGLFNDPSLLFWDFDHGRPPQVLRGHSGDINAVAISADGRWAVSGSSDKTVRLWNLSDPGLFDTLQWHQSSVTCVAISADGTRAISGSEDGTLCVWDLGTKTSLHGFREHKDSINAVAISGDGTRAISGSKDATARVWSLDGETPPVVIEGHLGSINATAMSADGKYAISGGDDGTVRLWDADDNSTPRVMQCRGGRVGAVAITADGSRVISGVSDGTLWVWDLFGSEPQDEYEERVRYTNAKVVLIGEGGSGKTGITVRLAHDLPPSRWRSTSGVWATQWPLKDLPKETGWDREVWLWDFGGQADQRLVHQLYLDHTAAVLLMFDADQDTVLPGLREWQQAIARSIPSSVPVLLLAGRTDVGARFHRPRVQEFARQSGYQFFETSAETNLGIPEMRNTLLKTIPWATLEQHNSPARFKRLKDEILQIRDAGEITLATFKELESLLSNRLPADFEFTSVELITVISLLDGPGIVKELSFGTYILLRPEWINIYAQAVIRTLRAAEMGLGYMPVSSIREGKLLFHPSTVEGQSGEEKRLRPEDEQIVLQSMESVLLDRRLCLRQNGDLVFPSYCGRERPTAPAPPHYFVSYLIDGFLDDIYSTLVVKLAHSGAFKLKELYRDAADFETLATNKLVGIRLLRREEGGGEILAHHAAGVTREEQVIFASYVHDHLKEQSTVAVQRQRHYICPYCDEPVENRKLAMERLVELGQNAEVLCPRCERRIRLWDRMEELFADMAIRKRVEELQAGESLSLDARRAGLLLVHEVMSRLLSADQKCIEIPQEHDEGIDLQVELTDPQGRGTGKYMYLQLKAGNSYLKRRKTDGAEIFRITKQAWVRYWLKVSVGGPIMLVIGSRADEKNLGARSDKVEFADVRWMEIGDVLRHASANGTKPVKRIVFKGERLDAASVLRWRDKATKASWTDH